MSSPNPATSSRAAKAHRTYILNGRKVMDYMRANPGATYTEIREATGHGPTRLQRMGLAKWKRVDGVVRWYLTGEVARPKEESRLEQVERENEGVRWVTYTNK